jgi:cytoskeletal protein RodZ
MPERKYEISDQDELDYAEVFASKMEGTEDGFTALQDFFAEWVSDKTDATSYYKTAKESQAFADGARAALWLRMYQQRSIENHNFKAEQANGRVEADEAAAELREQRKAEREEKRAAAEAAKAEKPARAPKATATKAAPAKATTTRKTATRATATKAPAAPAKAGRVASRRPAASSTSKARATKAAKGAEPEF